MANQLGYLVKRANGRYYARFQQPNGRWSHESLGAIRAAEAKVLSSNGKTAGFARSNGKRSRSRGLQKETAPQRLTPHSLRHTFASWLAIAGVSLRRIQELLGHKGITTTERYSHLGHNGQHPYYFGAGSVRYEWLCTKVCNKRA